MKQSETCYWNETGDSHYRDVIMGTMVSQITSFTIVYSTVYSGADQRKHKSSASMDVERGIHWSPMNSPHNGTVTRKMFPFDDVIMRKICGQISRVHCICTTKNSFINDLFKHNYKHTSPGLIFYKAGCYHRTKFHRSLIVQIRENTCAFVSWSVIPIWNSISRLI